MQVKDNTPRRASTLFILVPVNIKISNYSLPERKTVLNTIVLKQTATNVIILRTCAKENNKKLINASVKERPQTLLVPSEENCKCVLCNKHI